MSRADNDLTHDQWGRLLDAWNGCAYCGATDLHLQKDCVLPLSRGGRYTLDNVVPACVSCNASKCNDEVTSWMRRRRLDERRFLERFGTIVRALDLDHRANTGHDEVDESAETSNHGSADDPRA